MLILKQVEEDGTLQFPPFDAADFRAEVHSNIYRCRATNSVGSILSPEIHLRAGKRKLLFYYSAI